MQTYLLNALTSNYSHFVPSISSRDNPEIVMRKIRMPTLRNKVRIFYFAQDNSGIFPIPTLRRTNIDLNENYVFFYLD